MYFIHVSPALLVPAVACPVLSLYMTLFCWPETPSLSASGVDSKSQASCMRKCQAEKQRSSLHNSALAFFVTQTLRGLARDGRTVIASIHQPSSEVFELFDRLYLLSGAKTVYFGQASEACEFFAQAGFPCPPLRNPSDHFLRCINADFDKVKATLKGSKKMRFERSDDPLEQTTTSEAIRRLFSYCQRSQYYFTARQKVDEMAQIKGTVLDAGGSQASFGMQAFTLMKRSFINLSRDFGYYWLRLVIYIVVTVCIGSIYLNVGTKYSSILIRDLHVAKRTEDIGFYAGFVGASFMFGRCLTSTIWGMAADRIGRKPVVVFGIFSVLVTFCHLFILYIYQC